MTHADTHQHDQCVEALARVQEFLHHELDAADEDVIRQHLAACESCLDSFDVEAAISTLVRRSVTGHSPCPDELRARVSMMSIRVTRREA